MEYAEKQTGDRSGSADHRLVRWRPWPCAGCRGGSTQIGILIPGFGSDAEVQEGGRNGQIDREKKRQAAQFLEWVESCPHTRWSELCLPWLAEGSEHLVLFDEELVDAVKITLPGTYGDYYEIIDGRIHQFDSTPQEYLLRMHWWEKLFSTAPLPIGMTESGQIVSRQKFIQGNSDPPQETVDRFLAEAGAVAVKQHCWLWKMVEQDSHLEIWIGDARSDNFVLTAEGIVPIDIRIWGVPIL
ncbi:MAG: hypothetical protein EOP86_12700 [Verrucomicrobiaceae bacterium]|nr:MAG: hypothetical protein EOP86_12700 [Verrucomicrobiaceae bacterium]